VIHERILELLFGYCSNGSEMTAYDVQLKCLAMCFRWSGGKAYLIRGWSRFVLAKQLSEWDIIIFYELNCHRGNWNRLSTISIYFNSFSGNWVHKRWWYFLHLATSLEQTGSTLWWEKHFHHFVLNMCIALLKLQNHIGMIIPIPSIDFK
jgi:hypothetical protein